MAEINTVSYDQFSDIPSLGKKSKIIFSEKAFQYIIKLINETKRNNEENGCYLIGRKSISDDGALCFYFDLFTSKFETTDGNYKNSGVVPSSQSKIELLSELEKYQESGIEACIMHFHTHNLNGLFSSPSDQDYGVYATMKQKYQCEIFGTLMAPNQNTNLDTIEITILNCRDPKIVNNRACASFYSIPNIYYCQENDIYQIGSFEKNRNYQKTIQTEFSRPDRFVQNYREWQGTNTISAIGKNPNTNEPIRDEIVGYIDTNHNFIIAKENLTLKFPTLEKTDNMSLK